MFRYFQPRVYIVAATILFATIVAGGVGAVHWAYGIERMKLESCQRLLMALELERPLQFRGLVSKNGDPCRRLDEVADVLNLPREFRVRDDRLATKR
ncbi:MAG: hypothetical protein DMD96_23165 [Candidatus Rokuibacteriota bacterium]|nr:MAG: hypothetical protein DMD96_23165 [Candidatus Rokubacteria bacterium]